MEIGNEQDVANGCGFASGTRAVRSWRERITVLANLGFIEVHGKGTRDFAYVLMLHPHDAVARLKKAQPDRIPKWWWDLFTSRLRETGAPNRFDFDARQVGGRAAAEIRLTPGEKINGGQLDDTKEGALMRTSPTRGARPGSRTTPDASSRTTPDAKGN